MFCKYMHYMYLNLYIRPLLKDTTLIHRSEYNVYCYHLHILWSPKKESLSWILIKNNIISVFIYFIIG